MAKSIRITGIIEIEDDEFDSGPLGPLTEEADMKYRNGEFMGVDDLTFELVDE